MADRYDMERERDRERNSERDWGRNRDWDRNRDWGRDVGGDRSAGRREDWNWDRRSEFAGEGPRGGHEGGRWGNDERSWGNEGRNEWDRPFQSGSRYNERGGDEGWRNSRYSGSERTADYGNRGDWGRQGSWGTYGNRPDYNRENTFREEPALHSARVESDWGGERTGRTNLFGTGGGGFGTGMASYGAGMGNFGGTASYGGGMGRETERGPYSGRGPKGYQRSDDRIREDVNERLTDHPHIDASEIEVQVKNGEVTLSGTVDERQAKRLAEDIAESVSGVREVHNQIRVQQRETVSHGTGSQSNEQQRSTGSTQSRSK